MKAIPPTKGHDALLEFAHTYASHGLVLMDTAQGEPMVSARVGWLRRRVRGMMPHWDFKHIWFEPQFDTEPYFWDMWKDEFDKLGHFDVVIGSEAYCQKVADLIGATYIPFDPDREMVNTKASVIRQFPRSTFKNISPTFQHNLVTTVTIWGAESTGKTTLSKDLALRTRSHYVLEWARPYLETVGTEINIKSMTDIWNGQRALQDQSHFWLDRPAIIQDTDLFSTVGYWEQPHWADQLGPVPNKLIEDAHYFKSDLYIITKSNIPFEVDPLRYGGDHRESDDAYWIDIADKYGLNYVVLESADHRDRLHEATVLTNAAVDDRLRVLDFDRRGA